MQDKKVNKFVLLPVPLEDCAAAGICEGCILQSYTENGRLIISRVSKRTLFATMTAKAVLWPM